MRLETPHRLILPKISSQPEVPASFSQSQQPLHRDSSLISFNYFKLASDYIKCWECSEDT